MRRQTCVCTAVCSAAVAVGASFPLEWNGTYATDVPYEVDVNTVKLARVAAASPGGGFAVAATLPGGARDLPVVQLPSRVGDSVSLRFTVPAGTTALTCRTVPAPSATADPAACDNAFAGCLDAARWKAPRGVAVAAEADGVVLSKDTFGTAMASCTVPVPDGFAGQPVKFELDATSRTPMTWGGRIRIRQLDAAGNELPESVVDPRWTSHMRPCGVRVPYREEGHVHPDARSLRLDVELRYVDYPFDPYGLPLADKTRARPVLSLTHLALRRAAVLPFPKWDNANFAPGVSGAPGDCALVLGGADERAFWFQTRSQASWAENIQLRREEQVFFPPAAGTAEAWFRADWDAAGKNPLYLFEASHHLSPVNRPNTYDESRGAILAVCYVPASGTLSLELQDARDKKFKGQARFPLPRGRWFHLAACWAPGDVARVFVDGRPALEVKLAGFTPQDLAAEKRPNDYGAVEFYLGSTYASSRLGPRLVANRPLFDGAADLLRVSSGVRYAVAFTPDTRLAPDADTRALFTFDRSFDGVSGGGVRWISGSFRALRPRIARTLDVDGRPAPYWPESVVPAVDPDRVLNRLNYPQVPDARDFLAARRTHAARFRLAPGATHRLRVEGAPYMDFVEIANNGPVPLRYPILVNAGELDPRSFGDIADSLALTASTDAEKANRIFNFVLGASDYFMNHQVVFRPGSDLPDSVEYEALKMLNGYCGFECGPLNSLAANLFAAAGGLPASQTGGYGHSFEQVFFNGKNHIYDLSAQRFFASFDNETAACLSEVDVEPGIQYRLPWSADHFMRLRSRSYWAQNPSYQEKVGMVLNPGERFRVWFANDGTVNDLQFRPCFCGNKYHLNRPLTPYKEDYSAQAGCVDDPKRRRPANAPLGVWRINRFFPDYSNGFLVFDGAPAASNPAFTNVAADSFCYDVRSGYPIVGAVYAARLRNGAAAALEISTDFRTFRPLHAPGPDGAVRLDYAVRARQAYWIRVKAPIAEVASFRAETEVMLNRRVFPGRLRAGDNALTLRAVAGGPADVTVQWRTDAHAIEIAGGAYAGAIPGFERELVVLDPARGPLVLDVKGASPSATVRATANVSASLGGGRLTIAAPPDAPAGFAFVTVDDGGAEKDLTVLVCAGARFVRGAHMLRAAGDRAEYAFEPVAKGDYALFTLARFESHPKDMLHHPPLRVNVPLCDGQAVREMTAAKAASFGPDFYKADYGQKGGRSRWKWDWAVDPQSVTPYLLLRRLSLDGTSSLAYDLAKPVPNGVEVAAALLVPWPSEQFACDLVKILCGLNCDPARVR